MSDPGSGDEQAGSSTSGSHREKISVSTQMNVRRSGDTASKTSSKRSTVNDNNTDYSNNPSFARSFLNSLSAHRSKPSMTHPTKQRQHQRSSSLDSNESLSSSSSGGAGGQASQSGEQELATKMLQIQHKRFYLDVKQNRRGRFIKVAEVGAAGRKSRLLLAMSTAGEFRDHLTSFSELYASLGPPNPDNLPEDGKLKSEVMVKENRRYYLDLKENNRGRFLRVSQTIAQRGPRSQIAIPAQGMIEFRDALTDLLEEFGTDDGKDESHEGSGRGGSSGVGPGFKGELPEGKNLRIDNKKFYFDVGQNNLGVYMRVSEVKSNFRSSITIPEKSWARFRDVFSDYVDKMNESAVAAAAAASNTTASSSGPVTTTTTTDKLGETQAGGK